MGNSKSKYVEFNHYTAENTSYIENPIPTIGMHSDAIGISCQNTS